MIRYLVAFMALLCAAVPALAQSTYPTPAGTRVQGVVILQCDTAGANCTTAGNISGANSKVMICDFTVTCSRVVDPGDALAGLTGAVVTPFNQVFNGATWDRARGDANGQTVQPALSATFWNFASAAGGILNTTTAVTVKAAAGASVRNYVDSMECNSEALTTATELAIRDGAAGTVMWRGKIPTTGWVNPVSFDFNPPLKGTANTLVEIVTLTASGAGAVYCNLQGYTGI